MEQPNGRYQLTSKVTLWDLVSRVFQAQLVVLSAQIAWSENVETALSSIGGSGDAAPLHSVLSNVEVTLNVLADSVLMEQPPLRRRKLEHLVSPAPASLLSSSALAFSSGSWSCLENILTGILGGVGGEWMCPGVGTWLSVLVRR